MAESKLSLRCSLTSYKGGNASNPFSNAQKPSYQRLKGENLFLHLKNPSQIRAKRKKAREKEVFTVHSVLEACTKGKIDGFVSISSEKREPRSGHIVETSNTTETCPE